MRSGHPCVRFRKETSTSVIVPVRPATWHRDGYGSAVPPVRMTMNPPHGAPDLAASDGEPNPPTTTATSAARGTRCHPMTVLPGFESSGF
jgi:hypothetical protein